MRTSALALLTLGLVVGAAQAQEYRVTMHQITAEGIGAPVGTVTIGGSPGGATFTTDLQGLPPGPHGFHVHQNGDCGPGPNTQGQMAAGMAAGGHWDPASAGAHHGPTGDGHLGDLPVLEVASDGTAEVTLTAPRITDVGQLQGKALMIHAGGDNYSDQPQPLGGGAGRIACGVIQ